jgi:hypothetical protein
LLRPVGSGYDIGAFEFGSTITPTPSIPGPSNTPGLTATPIPPTIPPPLVGDFDQDGDVDFKDFLAFLPHFGDSGTTVYDLITNSLVNIFDFNQLLASFTIMPPPSSTPAPSPTPDQTGQSPYVQLVIPGTIEVENFDVGGPNIAYFDADSDNVGGAYRTSEGVDIEITGDTTGEYNVGWTAAEEWLEYTVTVSQTKAYAFTIRAAHENSSSTLHLEIDGTNVSGPITVPSTGGWQTYQDFPTTPVSLNLTQGTHIFRLFIESTPSGYGPNINYFTFN